MAKRQSSPGGRGEAKGDSLAVDSFDESIKTAPPEEVAPATPEKELTKSSHRWKRDFGDVMDLVGWRGIPDYYYKSECRPLKELRAHFRKGIVAKIHSHSFREWLEMRDRARKDLYWLGKTCIGTEQSGASFVEHVHKEICEMFVQKNFDGVYFKGFTLDSVRVAIGKQKREKEMLMLAPRGAFKSTANKIDAAHWMLNAPDIRMLIITGATNLSDKFLKEVKGYFYKPDGTAMTYFQSLFPEYVLTGSQGVTAADMVCPARICRQEGNPTLWVNSIGGTLAGWHCDVMKGDDIVNEENSNNEDTREKLKDRYDNVSANLPDEWAFRDQLGTRYYNDDWYGVRIGDAKKYGETNSLKYLCRSAWTVKPEFALVPIKKLQAHMVDLYFPEKLTFLSLISKCRQNEKQFRCQQLNEPAGGDLVTSFEKEQIEAHTIILNRVPRPESGQRRIGIVWDTGHSDTQSSADYSVGAVGYCHEATRSLYILEAEGGKWKDSETAVHLVDLHWKWNAMFSEVEKFAGWELFGQEVQRVSMMKYHRFLPLIWHTASNEAGAKRTRVKGLEILLNNDRLWFVDGEWMEIATTQFLQFNNAGKKKRKNDYPDAMAGLQKLIPAERYESESTAETDQERKLREAEELRAKFAARHNEIATHMMFTWVPPPAPAAAPEPARKIDPGPSRVFGNTRIHL